MNASRAEICVVACAEAWRGDGEIVASPMGTIPVIAARLARATFSPDLLMTDGEAHFVAGTWPVNGAAPDEVEGWIPYRSVFDLAAAGRRHVMMGPSQIDQFGNSNISCIGEHSRPKAQLLGVRGAAGNTVNHPTSYWVRRHSRRSFVRSVDMVSGVGYDRAAAAGPAASRFLELRRVVSNLAVFDFVQPAGRMRLLSLHPGVSFEEVRDNTDFELTAAQPPGQTRLPTQQELHLIRDVIDPDNWRDREISG